MRGDAQSDGEWGGGAEAKFRGGVVTGDQQLKLYLYIFLSKV